MFTERFRRCSVADASALLACLKCVNLLNSRARCQLDVFQHLFRTFAQRLRRACLKTCAANITKLENYFKYLRWRLYTIEGFGPENIDFIAEILVLDKNLIYTCWKYLAISEGRGWSLVWIDNEISWHRRLNLIIRTHTFDWMLWSRFRLTVG